MIGSKPPHVLTPEVRNKPYDIKDMFIDIGATSAAEAKENGESARETWLLLTLNIKRLNGGNFC